jgi:hypothetical protein
MSQKYPGGFITKSPPAPTSSAAKGIWTLDQAMQLQKQGLWPVPPPSTIGQAYGGGYYAGQIGVSGVATHYLVVGPKASAQTQLQWKNANTATTGANSVIDGPQNTADIVAGGNASVYPCAHFCNDLITGGYSDWYMPAINELDVCYFGLKPATFANTTSSGINANAIPARASNYTSGTPAQTSATIFRSGNAEAFDTLRYWTSNIGFAGYANVTARYQSFYEGQQGQSYKNSSYRVRAIRRIAI